MTRQKGEHDLCPEHTYNKMNPVWIARVTLDISKMFTHRNKMETIPNLSGIDAGHFRQGDVAVGDILPQGEAHMLPKGIAAVVAAEHQQRGL